MREARRPWGRLALTVAVGALCLVLALWGVDLRELGAQVAGVPAWRLVAVFALMLVGFALRVLRFHLLLGTHAPGLWRQAVASGIGFFAINALPLRLGEFVRPFYLERDGVPWGTSLAAVVLERVADLGLILSLLVVSAWVVDVPGVIEVGGVDVLQAGQTALGTVVTGGLVALLGVVLAGPRVAGWVRPLPRIGPALAGFVERFAAAARTLAGRPQVAGAVVVLTAIIWGTTLATVAVLLEAFDGLPTGFGPATLVTGVTVAGAIAVPTPGGFGPFEVFCRASLTIFGADAAPATALAGVWHVAIFVFTLVVGMAMAAADGVSILGVVRESRAR